MLYTTTISDTSTYGITAARVAYNASIPALIDDAPNPALLASDSAYLDFVLQNAVQSWCQQYAPVVVPEAPVTVVNGVPQSITKRQGRAQLKIECLLAPVEAHMASLPADDDLRMTYDDSTDWHRNSASVAAMLSMLGKDSAQADVMFVAAAKL